jgi:hypothetical protein
MLATEGRVSKPGWDLLRSACMAAAAACLVAASSSADGAWGGDPMDFDRTIKS